MILTCMHARASVNGQNPPASVTPSSARNQTSSTRKATSAGVSGIAIRGGRTTSQKLAIPRATRPAATSPSQISERLRSCGGSGQRDVVVLADSLQGGEERGDMSAVAGEGRRVGAYGNHMLM